MKKIMFISFISVSMLLVFIGLNSKSNYLREDNILGIYLDNKLQEGIPKKGEAVFSKAVCDNNATNFYWDIDKWGLFISNLSKKTKCNLYFVNYSGQTIFDFDYTGSEQTFTAPVSGTYRLETWGAQGSDGKIRDARTEGGYGGYSRGQIKISKNDIFYLQIGGNTGTYKGGYNGGGNGNYDNINNAHFQVSGGGGGATHIANKSGLLSELESYKNNIFIVAAGGGGGANANLSHGGHAGGYIGNNGSAEDKNTIYIGIGGNQNSGGNSNWGLGCGKFGVGGYARDLSITDVERFYASGGGSGFYGGSAGDWTTNISMTGSGGGGSSYIGNSSLTNKAMYCYNCEESNEESTKTISTTCSEETPTGNCAKKGNGYARITLVSID